MKEAEELFEKFKAGNCTSGEVQMLLNWFHQMEVDDQHELTEADLISAKIELRKKMSQLINQEKTVMLWPRILSAAVLFIAISFGIYFYLNLDGAVSKPTNISAQIDIPPGGNKAILTLADGRKISLADAENGKLAEQSGIKVIKTADGQLEYTISNSDTSSQLLSYNTIETPAGGQYQINLPDGTKVWLNSASSLRYPIRFTGKGRSVEITGEAYFEVAHNKLMPFRVITADQTIEVLGTHFNVMAYQDESSTNTTLIEGSVKVVKGNTSKVISPGQQTRVKEGQIEVVSANIQEVTAWKNGYFIFKSEDVRSIMRQIARWYDLDVEYQGNVSEKIFGAKISRFRNVSEVLSILESTGSIHFKIINESNRTKGRRIIVMP